jgi:hypothetical protein
MKARHWWQESVKPDYDKIHFVWHELKKKVIIDSFPTKLEAPSGANSEPALVKMYN